MNEKYEKIIDLPHYVSKNRIQMATMDRAAQFAPYSALSGYEDAVEETARLTESPTELDEYEKEKINAVLTSLFSSPQDTKVKITYFRPDKRKSGGAYITVTGEVSHIDEYSREIVFVSGYSIFIDSIFDIQKADNS